MIRRYKQEYRNYQEYKSYLSNLVLELELLWVEVLPNRYKNYDFVVVYDRYQAKKARRLQ